jgi:hypothetical protein
MPNKKRFKVGNDVYEIDEQDVNDFLSDNPNATQNFAVGNDVFEIQAQDVDAFLADNPNAKEGVYDYIKVPAPTQESKKKIESSPIQSSVVQSNTSVSPKQNVSQSGGNRPFVEQLFIDAKKKSESNLSKINETTKKVESIRKKRESGIPLSADEVTLVKTGFSKINPSYSKLSDVQV